LGRDASGDDAGDARTLADRIDRKAERREPLHDLVRARR
jgi:hypothetical protein